jgi:hypothetical protein
MAVFLDRSITITVSGDVTGYQYWQDGGPHQASPAFLRDKNGNPWQSGIAYLFFAMHPELAPDPRLIRIYFTEDGIQSIIREETALPAGSDDLDDVSLRTDLTVEAVAPDGVMMSVLTSVGYILRRFTPESFRLWLGFIFPDAQELIVLREMLEIPDESEPEYVAPDDTELAGLRNRLNIPEPVGPAYVAPVGDALDELLLELGIRRRGGLPSIPLSEPNLSFLGWQLWPYIGFGPLVPMPPGYVQLVDEETASGIAKQIGLVWGIDIPLTGAMPRIILEYAEVLILAEQLYKQYGYEPLKPPTLLEQLNELSDELLEAIRAKINTSAPSLIEQMRNWTEEERNEARDIIPCCEDEGTAPSLVLTTVAHWEPVPTGSTNRAPVLNNRMLDQDLAPSASRVFYLPADEFTDPDGDALTLTAKKTDGSALPSQIIFTAAQRKFEITDAYETPTAILVTATDPGGLFVTDDFLLTFQTATTPTNQKPYVFEEMPDVPIRTAGQYSFALPDDHIRDPDNDPLTLLITQEDGSPLPAWLSYKPQTRTFTKADGFDNVSAAMAVKATDPGGLFVVDTFLIVVQSNSSTVIILSVRKKAIVSNGFTRWILYVKTDPQTSFTTGGSLYYRARTMNGGLHDSGFTTWQATLNNQASVGDYFSQDELDNGFTYLLTENTFTGEDTDASHSVIVQLAITQDGANAKEYTFTVTENQTQPISPLYPVV